MSRYYPLKVDRVVKETEECVSVWLNVPGELKSKFAFIPGQHLHCRAVIDGEETRKSYSICSIPEDQDLVIAVKMVHGGKFSTYVNTQLKAGDTFEVTPPEGKFILPKHLQEDAVVLFFAAGSGITPVISLIRHFLLHYPLGQAILFYTNKSSDTIIFREELEGLKNKFMTRFSVYHVLTREVTAVDILSGRIDQEKCRAFAKHFFDIREVSTAFICGPELMIHDLRQALQDLGLKPDQIKYELFGSGPYERREKQKEDRLATGENIMSKVTIRFDGHETNFQIGYLDQPVLDVAMQSGLDLPYSCKGGVCSTCRALVVEGKVHMDIQYGLEPDEIDAG
ncbi:MAG TPA: FAD-binding oxidoreductase, partial [Saprospiraceae bacterium]|nr:FAD-binding oxidoreductase [Saprospiraceae bacterium]